MHIGDYSGRVITGHEVKLFTICQTSNITKYRKEYTAYEIRNVICNNIKHPCGYGVLNGDEGAMAFIQTGSINIGSIDQVILSSDEMEDYLLQMPVNVIREKDAQWLLDNAMKFNDKLQDDRSVIRDYFKDNYSYPDITLLLFSNSSVISEADNKLCPYNSNCKTAY